MRYTTIIDISEIPEVYKNLNARLLYLHLVLKSGYRDTDRDVIKTSLRRLEDETGLTFSAVRHSFVLLAKHGLATKTEGGWRVLKWIVAEIPTPRRQPAKTASAQGNIAQEMEKQMAEWQEKVLRAVREMSIEELETWAEELANGKALKHHGAQLNANKKNEEWLRSVIKTKKKNNL